MHDLTLALIAVLAVINLIVQFMTGWHVMRALERLLDK